MEENIKISIVTVCFNAEKVIEETIQSVLKQTYRNIEYIIVDGASKDGTLDIIRKYESDERIRSTSEPDMGIYDAMNKGSRQATGDYIQFLNAGDMLIDASVIEKVAAQIEESKADVVYGDIIYQYPDGSKNRRVYGQFCSSWFYYLLGDCINHQAMFASKTCFDNRQFDLTYRICADREWMLRLKKERYTFRAMNILVCEYSLDENSASVQNRDVYFEEAARCIKEHLKAGYWLYWVIDRIRHGKFSIKVLHGIYKVIYIRKT